MAGNTTKGFFTFIGNEESLNLSVSKKTFSHGNRLSENLSKAVLRIDQVPDSSSKVFESGEGRKVTGHWRVEKEKKLPNSMGGSRVAKSQSEFKRFGSFLCVKASPGVETKAQALERVSESTSPDSSSSSYSSSDTEEGQGNLDKVDVEKIASEINENEKVLQSLLAKARALTAVGSRPAEVSQLEKLLKELENEPRESRSDSELRNLSARVKDLSGKVSSSSLYSKETGNSNNLQYGGRKSRGPQHPGTVEELARNSSGETGTENKENGNSQGAVPQFIERSEFTAMRSRLNIKLSEANAYSRHLKREIQRREESLKTYKSQLSTMELELKELSSLAKDLALQGSKGALMKVNGKFVHSHLASKLEELHEVVKGQVEGVEASQLREVAVEWFGMAEDVKVMGSFDNWLYGEQMSPEGTGTNTRFTLTLKLRPGRYEVKFLVDGEWRIAPGWETVGSGLAANNLLVVE